MIINGTNFNNAAGIGQANSVMNAGLQKKTNQNTVLGSAFAKRFDRFELSSFFKDHNNTDSVKADVSDIKQMLSDIKNEDEKDVTVERLAAYNYMIGSVVAEAVKTMANEIAFSRYSEEKQYYQGLLNKADGIETGDTVQPEILSFYDYYEYKQEGDFIDREKVEKALANVQRKIDDMLNNTASEDGWHKKLGEVTSQSQYNKCAGVFAGAFGIDGSDVSLSGNKFNKAFGKIDASEEDYLRKCIEKRESLYEIYDSLEEKMSDVLERISDREDGDKIVSEIKDAMNKMRGTSYRDIVEFAVVAGLFGENEGSL